VGYKLKAALKATFVPEIGPLPSFTRNLAAYVQDFDGLFRQVPANCARFAGARFVKNLLANSNLSGTPGLGQYPTGWQHTGNDLNAATLIAIPNTFGATFATQIRETAAGGFLGLQQAMVWQLNVPYVIHARLRVPAGVTASTANVYFGGATPAAVTLATAAQLSAQPTDTWVWYSVQVTFTASTSNVVCFINPGNATGTGFDIAAPMVELVAGQSNKNPSDYLSTGLLTFPFYGAGADGCAFYDYQNGNTVTGGVVTAATGAAISKTKNQSASLVSGSLGDYFQTPDALSLRITGDVDIRVNLAMPSWTVSLGTFVSKRSASTAEYCFRAAVAGGGKLNFFWFETGGLLVSADSTAAVPFTAGTAGWIRATRQASNGAGHAVITFYTSTDGVNWTQLGAPVLAAAVAAPVATTNALTLGRDTGASNPLIATIYRAQVYSGINGTLVADFNPNDYASGATWRSGTTGETWTINGAATIRNFPLRGYRKERSATNSCLQSTAFDNASWAKTGSGLALVPVVTPDFAIAPDGTLTADRVQFDLNGGTTTGDIANLQQAFTYTTGLPYTFAVWLKSNTGVNQTLALFVFNSQGANITVTPQWQRFVLIQTPGATAASSFGLRCRGAQSMTTPADISIWGGYHEQTNLVPTSDIPTTTAAVNRPEDLLIWLGVLNDAAGTCSALAEPDAWTANDVNNRRVLGGGTVSESGAPLFASLSGFGTYDNTAAASTSVATPTGAVRGAAVWSAATSTKKAFINGVASNGGNAYDGSFNNTGVGIGVGGGLPWQGYISEVVVLDNVLSDFDIPSLPDYKYPRLIANAITGALTKPAIVGSLSAPTVTGALAAPAIAGSLSTPSINGALAPSPSIVGILSP
jgi:hypothetical protein